MPELKNDSILTLVDQAIKMVHLPSVQQTIIVAETTCLFWEESGHLHRISRSIVLDQDPKLMFKFWQKLWRVFGEHLMDVQCIPPQTYGQSEAMNSVVEMILQCVLHAGLNDSYWETLFPTVEFVINNSPTQLDTHNFIGIMDFTHVHWEI